MIFHQIDAGGDRNFAYLVADAEGGKAAIVDPPPDPSRYKKLVDRYRLQVVYVIVTHGHGDHTCGVSAAVEETRGRVVAHALSPVRADLRVRDGDLLDLGAISLRFIHTPGHTEDSMCVLADGKLITGDTLFVGKVGGTDYGEEARREYDSLRKLMTLDDEVEVWPGHDYGVSPASTIGRERTTNPFLLRDSFESFVELKRNWLRYKQEHGIA